MGTELRRLKPETTITRTLLNLRAHIIRDGGEGLRHVNALLRLWGCALEAVPKKVPRRFRRGELMRVIRAELRNGPLTAWQLAERIAQGAGLEHHACCDQGSLADDFGNDPWIRGAFAAPEAFAVTADRWPALLDDRHDDAAACFAAAARAKPTFSTAYIFQAIALVLAGHNEPARRSARQGLEFEPDFRARMFQELGLAESLVEKFSNGARLLNLPK